ncbi:hypothetical protein [uncultured Sulfitobacter sp.]|jgi:VIT1/CCC1 family predicted Fe2+/Mn2+ transporter|nr:hypothetical protein [uncultured Sulfitobacter sp.]MBQ0803502.1 hypothetical protein [Sulfitobacter sp.]
MGGIWWFVLSALTIIPMVRLLPFFGINKYWAAACVVPFGVIALLWWMGVKLAELERK